MKRKGNKTEVEISTFNAKKRLYYCKALSLSKRDVFDNAKKNQPYEKKGKQNRIMR